MELLFIFSSVIVLASLIRFAASLACALIPPLHRYREKCPTPGREWLAGFFVALVILGSILYIQITAHFEARIRQNAHLTRTQLGQLQNRLDSYHAAHKQFPPMRQMAGSRAPPHMTFDMGEGALSALQDPFSSAKDRAFAYHTDGQRWLLYSAGPDKDYDIDAPNELVSFAVGSLTETIAKTYDPTNGTASNGDIWLAGRVKKSESP